MSVLSFTPLNKPKVDIGTITFDSRISATTQISIMSDKEFEQFTTEWLYGCKSNQYKNIVCIGGSGDMGRDVIAYHGNGEIDYYQCKHYDNTLAPSQIYVEFGKLCYYTYNGEIPVPKNYFIIASKGIGSALQKLIDSPKTINIALVKYWDKYCKTKITSKKSIVLDLALKHYISNFDFSVVTYYPIGKILNEHLSTKYGYFRFGGEKVERPTSIAVPDAFEDSELTYIKELYCVYSECIGRVVNSLADLESFAKYLDNFQQQRKYFFAAETIRRFVRDTFSENDEFDILKEEVFEGIIDIFSLEHSNSFERMTKALQVSTQISTTKSLLDSKLHYVGNSERKGICHMIVNDKKIKWVTE